MKLAWLALLAALMIVVVVAVPAASGAEDKGTFSATLTGFHEVAPILTDGHGTLHATVNGTNLTYTLTFADLTTQTLQAHLHFAETGVNGGIFLFLCSNLGNGPAGTPACPANGGTVTRTVTAADIVSVAGQNVSAGDFAGALRIIRAGDAYANVHSQRFPAGEIRGQVRMNDD